MWIDQRDLPVAATTGNMEEERNVDEHGASDDERKRTSARG